MAIRDYQPKQFTLFFANPRVILGEDHFCFIVDDLVEHLDLSNLPEKQGTVGAPCYDYRLLIKVLFYGYATGTFSSRKLMKAVQENIAYLYLTRQQVPNFRTISDFRKNHSQFLEDSFVQIVTSARDIGIAKLGEVSLDSSKIRANASNQKTFSQEELKEQQKRIKKAIEDAIKLDEEEDRLYGSDKTGDELPDALKDRKKRLEKIRQALQKAKKTNQDKVNLTDHDAHYMKGNNVIQTNYNCHLSVDNKSKMILAKEVSTSAADVAQLKAQVGSIEKTYGKKPKELFADSGYYSVENLSYLHEKQIKGYIPHPNEARALKDKLKTKPKQLDKEQFSYNSGKDCYICPAGKTLSRKTVSKPKGLVIYQARDCPSCKQRKACLRGKARYRHIARYVEREGVIMRMKKRLKTKLGKAKYAQRAPTVETPFAHFKSNLGFRQFLRRGLPNVSSEFTLLCIGYNIRKMARHIANSGRKKRFYTALAG